MPSSLTTFLSRALVYSTFLPVSVLVRSPYNQRLEAFLGSTVSLNPVRPKTPCPIRSQLTSTDLPMESPTPLDHHFQSVAELTCCVPPSLLYSGTGILNPFPIDYAFQPCLRGRLTLGGRTFPRKPYPYGDMDFNHVYRYLSLDYHFQPLH